MNKTERSFTRWFTAWRARPKAAAMPDPADFGTTFGLELSLPGAEPVTQAAPPPGQGWRARWGRRRRVA